MENVGGSVFAETSGKCINLMHLFVATRGEIFSLKFIIPFGGRALRGPAGELKRSPRPPSRNKGVYFLGEGNGGEAEGEGALTQSC